MANGWIIGQCCFYHLPLKEIMTYHQFRGEKRVQRPSLLFLVLRLSSFTIAAWVELILWISVLPHIVWIESHLLLSLLDYKILVTKNLIQYHQCRKRRVPMLRPSKKNKQPESINNHGGHLPDYQTMRRGCTYCAMEGKENRTFAICFTCNILLCLTKRKNCFQKHPI